MTLLTPNMKKNDLDEYRDLIVSNYNNALAGKNNCIPFLFPKMQQYYPGHDKGMLLGITGSAKSGKTALVSQMFFYSTMDYLYKNPDAFSVHFLWFALEESKRKFFARLDSYLLNRYYGIRVDYNTLMSKTADKRMPEKVFKIWTSDKYKLLVDFYTERLTLVKYKKTSEAILNEINKFATGLGHVIKEKGAFDVADVCHKLCDKLIFRHPHVYGDVVANTPDQVRQTWEQIKTKEKDGNKTVLRDWQP